MSLCLLLYQHMYMYSCLLQSFPSYLIAIKGKHCMRKNL